MALNPRQRLFVREYLVDLNATEAAKRAGYSPDSAGAIGEQNLKKLEIRRAVEKAIQERERRLDVSADRVLAELALVAFSDVTEYTLDSSGKLKLPVGSELASRAVQSVKRKEKIVQRKDGKKETTVESEVRLWNKVAALDLLMKHLGLGEGEGRTGGSNTGTSSERRARVLALAVERRRIASN